jgi:hypothetical protein
MFANPFHSTGSAGVPAPSGLPEPCGFDPMYPNLPCLLSVPLTY